jgi:hypothetical protein
MIYLKEEWGGREKVVVEEEEEKKKLIGAIKPFIDLTPNSKDLPPHKRKILLMSFFKPFIFFLKEFLSPSKRKALLE